jgi:polyphenol oxidase
VQGQGLTGQILGERGFFLADSGERCDYAMFSRHGGVGEGLYASLNVGSQVGDRAETVAENRVRVRVAMEVPALLTARQVHGAEIYCLTEPLSADREIDGVDALITALPGVGLTVQQADCQAVLLFDPQQAVIAAIHCGWRGSIAGIVERVVEIMTASYGTDPRRLQAVISPSLGPCCAEFINYHKELPEEYLPFRVNANHFDFWRITAMQLQRAGLLPQGIRVSGRCTCCSDAYFSYRRASKNGGGATGRNCSVIALRSGRA